MKTGTMECLLRKGNITEDAAWANVDNKNFI